MTKDESLALTAEIAGRICSSSLTVEYSDDEAEQARRAAPTERLRRLRAAGLLEYSGSAPTREEWERYYVIDALCRELSLYDRASGDYLRELFAEARRFTPRQLYSDPYMLDLSIPARGARAVLAALFGLRQRRDISARHAAARRGYRRSEARFFYRGGRLSRRL